MAASESDEILFSRLSLKASASSLDLSALKQSIRNAIETDFVDYYHMRAYVDDSVGSASYEIECWQEIHLRACEAVPPENDEQRELLATLLFDREINAAWFEANDGDCNAELWKRLGEKLGDSEPSQATFCWQRLVEPIIKSQAQTKSDESDE